MADTGAPYFIPYVEPTDLVRDYPAADEASADAIAAALDGIPVLAGIGSNVVQTVKTDTFTTASTTDVLITGLEATITPSSATSKVLVIAQIRYSNTSTGDNTFLSIYRTSTRIGAGNDNFSGGDRHPSTTMIQDTTLLFVDSPATTSATTYSARVRAANGTSVINRRGSDTFGQGLCSITVIEVAA